MSKPQDVLQMLRDYESRNVTYMAPDGSWPIVWERARGMHVFDATGRRYLDMTAAFGVAAAGHANPAVVRAGSSQMRKLLHAMGDVHPHSQKAMLARELSRLTFERWEPRDGNRGKVIFCNSGFEAVEAALKTALLATGKPRVLAFEGGYHGLGYGALNATHRDMFRSPFRRQLREFCTFVPFPTAFRDRGGTDFKQDLASAFTDREIGAVLVEPIQVRGGIRIPPEGFLTAVRRLCDEHGALLILDEIYTGFGRTGAWFACEHEEVVPDVVCLGKALTGGFPLSACIGRAELMDAAWPKSSGEAIHTSTFLGHPVGCAMALAQIQELKRLKLVQKSRRDGAFLLRLLQSAFGEFTSTAVTLESRGKGLLAAVEVRDRKGRPATELVLRVIAELLRRGFIFLPEGEHANVVGFTPPLVVSRPELTRAVKVLAELIRKEAP